MVGSRMSGAARAARLVADVLRGATLLSALATVVFFGGHGVVIFVVLFAVLLLPRFLEVAAPFDAAFCATMLVAAWAEQQNWYVTVSWVDEVVHSVTPGAAAVATYLMLARLDVMPDVREHMGSTRRFSLVVLVVFVGLGLATLWEFYEWVAEQLAPQATQVGYDDTISDLALGGAGSLVAGVLLVTWFRLRHEDRHA
ncbi:MAG: hypothetical protein WB441_14700 [Nocardioidaceae bacterium]